jgi:hypothetical protein
MPDECQRDDATRLAEAILARARAECIAAGVTPRQLADLLLPEALLALMMAGLDEHETVRVFRDYLARDVRQWYLQAGVATERCDCAREHAEVLAD